MIEASSIMSGPGFEPWAPGGSAGLRSGALFSQVMHNAAQGSDRDVAREAAAKLVSSTFVMPVLESLRESPFLGPPFAPSFAQKRFQPLLDQQIADRITTAANFPLVDMIVDQLLGESEHKS